MHGKNTDTIYVNLKLHFSDSVNKNSNFLSIFFSRKVYTSNSCIHLLLSGKKKKKKEGNSSLGSHTFSPSDGVPNSQFMKTICVSSPTDEKSPSWTNYSLTEIVFIYEPI